MPTRTYVPRLRPAQRRTKVPGLRAEQACWDAGDRVVCGLDEVGRGAWAGPVTVGAVVIPRDRRVYKLRDSKMLNLEEREALYPRICEWVVGYGVGHASHAECDSLGMTVALRRAARRALAELARGGCEPDRMLLDGAFDYIGDRDRVRTIVEGDASSLAIAAASIIAKVTRDRMMAEEAVHYPAYEFDTNRGYPAPRHQYALQAYGPTAIHRRSWIFMEGLPWFSRPAEPAQTSLFA